MALAHALEAEACELYTDVPGVFTTDPRVVADARRMDRISFDELLEMTTICGPEGYVKERLAAYKEAGVTNLQLTPIGDPVEIIEKVRAWVD